MLLELVFDVIVVVVCVVIGMIMGLISVVVEDCQWFKVNIGFEGVSEMVCEIFFCIYVICQDELFEIFDVCQDLCFFINLLVIGGLCICYYVGIFLGLVYGVCIGMLCLFDLMFGVLFLFQCELMVYFVWVIIQVLEQCSMLMVQVGQVKVLYCEFKCSEDFLECINCVVWVGGWEMDLVINEVCWICEIKQLYGVCSNFELMFDIVLLFYCEDSCNIIWVVVQCCIDEGMFWEVQLLMIIVDGCVIWIWVVGSW